MTIQENKLTLESLEGRLDKQGRLLKFTAALLFLTIGFLMTHWVLGFQGRLNLRAKEVAVYSDSGSYSARIHPSGLRARHFDDPNRASYMNRAELEAGDGGHRATRLLLAESSSDGSWGGSLDLHVYAPGRISGLVIRDFEGKERARLTVSEAGPKLELLDQDGQVLFQAP